MVHEINTGDTAWLLTSAALVLLMTPGLAFFYGGMVRAKGVLNMVMMSFVSIATVGVAWAVIGYSEAFGNSLGGVLGNPVQFAFLDAYVNGDPAVGTVPALAFAAFQGCFAIIAVALLSGAIAERTTFASWTLLSVLWLVVVYAPVAHWVFAADGLTAPHGGWIVNRLHAVDLAGGTAIEVACGAGGLALAIVLGRRLGFGSTPMRPHNMTLVMLGAGLLWFGWFGFNSGSALVAGTWAALIWVNTLLAPCAAMLAWLLVEKRRDGHATSLGAASGAVAGLVAITPSGGSVSPLGAMAIGLLAGAICAWAVSWKYRFGLDDSLDLVGVHLVGGVVGTLGVGLLADPRTATHVRGLFYGGGVSQLWRQAVAVLVVGAFSFVMTWLLATVVSRTMGMRVSTEAEMTGIDLAEHSETGYDLTPVQHSAFRGVSRPHAHGLGDRPAGPHTA
ncbi:ammonium transporter [Raineyella sp. LH-20]|uniref:ammonium transporter n=1 Tax=Raineyella sp. LH-20 TaxID=3081204 RepID=UPI00295576E0|nr:ammonium transporter [Raineyella sp. LH-20]WOP18146.1 ammonium transporter [Raineyella sp. LH-20]